MKFVHGRTRSVLLIGNYAVKFPYLKSWKPFLRGLLDNMFEAHHADSENFYLMPVLFSCPGGFFNVMPRAKRVLSDKGCIDLRYYLTLLYRRCKKYDPSACKAIDIIEVWVPENYGVYDGRVVCLDYGHGRNVDQNEFLIEEMMQEFEGKEVTISPKTYAHIAPSK